MTDEVSERDERERLGAVAATGLDAVPDPAMDRLAGLVARLLGGDVSLVSLVDDVREFFPGQHGLRSPWSSTREAPLSQSICRLVVQNGATVRVEDTASDERLADIDARSVLGVGSYLGVPLIDAQGHVLGSLCAIDGAPRRWSDEDERLLADLAHGASSELRARIAATVARQATERVQLMADTSVALDASLDPRQSLTGLLDVVVPALATWALLWARPEPDGRQLAVARHVDPTADGHLQRRVADDLRGIAELAWARDVLEDDAVTARALDATESLALAEYIAAPDDTAPFQQAAVLVVPVLDRYDRLGILALSAPVGVAELSALDQALAADLGRRAGTALRNARAYDHERQVATTLQRSLMPRLSDVAGLDACGAYEPVAVGTEVGGDWYDVLALVDGSVAVTIGDVTGHSMEAAAAMGRLSGAIRCYSYDGLGPAAILRHLDRLHDHLLDGLLVTCTCLRLRPRPDGWAVTISNAGHLPPILVAPGLDGPAVTVGLGRGPMIGAYSDPTRADGDLHLPWGALLVLCTDGLIERRTETIDQSVERLRTSTEALDRTAPLDDICAKLSAGLRPEGDDDVAVLCLRATPKATP